MLHSIEGDPTFDPGDMRRSSPRRRQPSQFHEDESDVAEVQSEAATEPKSVRRPRALSHVEKTKQWGKWLLRRRPFFFGIGIAVGLLVAFFTVSLWRHQGMMLSLDQSQLALSFADVNPSNAFLNALQNVLPENRDLFRSVSTFLADQLGYANTSDGQLPGKKLRREEHLAPHHPVVLVPGIVSTGLESWSSTACTESYFRKRLWGEMTMGRMMLLDKECWLSHLMLDPDTGLDPPNIRLRAAQGLDAADYLIGPYWVWGKLIENLGAIGYDSNNLHMAAYDWRLSVTNMEKRDHYFTKLKNLIEVNVKAAGGEKAALIAHSMGTNILLYFFKWVESPSGGNGGDGWVDQYVDAVVNIGGPLLGLPKTISSVLSGEMRDTAQMGRIMSYFLDRFFTKSQRAGLFRSWMGASALLPKGLERIWGDGESAPDDTDQRIPQTNGTVQTYGQMVRFDRASIDKSRAKNDTLAEYLTAKEINDFIADRAEAPYGENVRHEYDWGILDKDTLKKNPEKYAESKYWTNPLTLQLPNAPKMKMYCLYGIGKETERAYHYQMTEEPNGDQRKASSFEESKHGAAYAPKKRTKRSIWPKSLFHKEGKDARPVSDKKKEKQELEEEEEDDMRLPPDWPPTPPTVHYQINTEMDDRANNVEFGVQDTDGDGTVPLISLGYMCVEGWQKPEFNPHNIEIITQELQHDPVSSLSDVRGGPKTADHVDILGNNELASSVLHIVAGNGEKVKTDIKSRIREIARRIKLWDDDTHHQGASTDQERQKADDHDQDRNATA